MKKFSFLLGLTLFSNVVWAHPNHGSVLDNGFFSGLLHPVSGWDHILAMVSVGLWAASFNGNKRFAIPLAFVLTMMLGFFLGANGMQINMMEQGIAASVLVIGLAAAWANRAPVSVAIAVVSAFALFHGVAHGAELHGGAWLFGLGFVISTVALHVAGFFAGTFLRKNIWVSRAVGTLIGAVGLGMLLV